jgi:hypothetical protein
MKNKKSTVRKSCELKSQKCGMYGEMPIIRIENFTISDMSNEENCSTIWIENTLTGEGGQFSKKSFRETLSNHFKEFF